MTLPDCMMPDGADPCRGYQEQQAKIGLLANPTDAVIEAGCRAAQKAGLLSAHTGSDVAGQRGPFFHILRTAVLPAILKAAESPKNAGAPHD